MRILWLFGFLLLIGTVAVPDTTLAQQGPGPRGGPPCMYRGMPFGHFCPGHGRGPYGTRKPVRTAEEAKQLVESYFAGLGENVTIGKTEEKNLFFEVEILGQDGALIDKAIVDKRTGRIRSIYETSRPNPYPTSPLRPTSIDLPRETYSKSSTTGT